MKREMQSGPPGVKTLFQSRVLAQVGAVTILVTLAHRTVVGLAARWIVTTETARMDPVGIKAVS